MNIAWTTGIFLALLILSVGILPAVLILYLPRHLFPYSTNPRDCCGIERYMEFSIPSTDVRSGRSIALHAWLFEPSTSDKIRHPHSGIVYNSSNSDACIVVAHGHGANMGRASESELSILTKAVHPLLAAGFTVLAFDQRNHGNSSYQPPVTLGYVEAEDIPPVLDWLLSHTKCNPKRVGAWGESMGAATVMFAAARDSRIRAIVADSNFVSVIGSAKYWFKDKVEWMPEFVIEWVIFWLNTLAPAPLYTIETPPLLDKLQIPVFVVHGRDDGLVPVSHVERLQGLAVQGGKTNWSFRFHAFGHCKAYKDPDYLPEMVQFFQRVL